MWNKNVVPVQVCLPLLIWNLYLNLCEFMEVTETIYLVYKNSLRSHAKLDTHVFHTLNPFKSMEGGHYEVSPWSCNFLATALPLNEQKLPQKIHPPPPQTIINNLYSRSLILLI